MSVKKQEFTKSFTKKKWSIQGYGLDLNSDNTPTAKGYFPFYNKNYYGKGLGREMVLELDGLKKSGEPKMKAFIAAREF